MHRRALFLALALLGCGSADQPDAAPEPAPSATLAPTPSPAASVPAGRDYSPPELVPEAAKGEKGARNLLLAWARAMEDRAFAEAYALFGDYAARTGMNAAQYAAAFANYRTVTVAVGDTGDPEGAAGSLYYEAPLTLTGTRADGATYRRSGTITLRRVNDVPGATPEQLRWHLERLAWDDAS